MKMSAKEGFRSSEEDRKIVLLLEIWGGVGG